MDRLYGSLRLKWKLTISYTVVTVAALLAVELILILGLNAYLAYRYQLNPRQLIQDIEASLGPVVRPYLVEAPLGIEMYWLQQLKGVGRPTSPLPIAGDLQLEIAIDHQLDLLMLVAADGTLLGVVPEDSAMYAKIGQLVDTDLIPGLQDPLDAALVGEQDYGKLYSIYRPENKLVAAVPVYESSTREQVIGVIAFTTDVLPSYLWPLGVIAKQVGYSLICLTLLVGLTGSMFGSLTARNLVTRFKRLSESAGAWSHGDFSVLVQDTTGDELSHLAHDLNNMAHQLESLLNERQEMSVMEERNRLARDLHDSAKQQAFAASAQLGAARARLKQDPEAAATHLAKAETLVHSVRQELTHLIQELRPLGLKNSGLASALQECTEEWAKQTDIEFSMNVQGERSLPLEIEQTMFRIAQEALANVARHSAARHTEISLIFDTLAVTLTIADDGCGFDTCNPHGGVGLQSMVERAELLKGDLTIKSTPGKGTTISLVCVA